MTQDNYLYIKHLRVVSALEREAEEAMFDYIERHRTEESDIYYEKFAEKSAILEESLRILDKLGQILQ